MLGRRQWLGGSLSGFFAFAFRNQLASSLDRLGVDSKAKAKRCVVLWMEGGPSQLDTFDPKPGTANGGPIRSLSTAADNLEISHYLPKIAEKMDQLSVVRNLTSPEGEHVRATHYLHTGFKFVPSFPRPSFGSVVSSVNEDLDFPKYVSLGSQGFGPAFLGPRNGPFSIENLGQAKSLLDRIRRRTSRLDLLTALDHSFSKNIDDPAVEQRRAQFEKIQRMATTQFSNALDIERYSTNEQNRYGNHEFGRRCLAARKLLELGVNFVEVQLNGWDTHQQNFRNVERLCRQLDQPFAALVEDLKQNGMFEDTVIVWMGEFGRTPNINSQAGRDHFPRCTPVVVGGGPFKTGFVEGATSENGMSIVGQSHTVADLFATLYSAFGIEPDKEFTTDFGSPTTATEDGKIITSLLT